MPRKSKERIASDEKMILRKLKKKSKESIEKIAKECGFSKQKVWRVIKNLEKDKTIWGYSTIIDNEKVNLTHYTILFKRSIVPLDKNVQRQISEERLDDYFPDLNITIEDCLFVNGSYDWIVTFTAPGIREMKKFCEKLTRKFSEHIVGYEVLETIITIRKQGIKNPSTKDQVCLL
jgi:DNA-binding Lrp family transcriptional regulator